MKLLVASNNKNKIREIKTILGDLFEVISLSEAGVVSDPEETGASFGENALIKARAGMKVSGLPCIADDSGLCVPSLGGAPGIYSARYSGTGDDGENNKLLLKNMKDITDRRGIFISEIALVYPEGQELLTYGECRGEILYEERGTNGFGYDPLFLVNGYGKTYAELSSEIKNEISHRAEALKKLRKILL